MACILATVWSGIKWELYGDFDDESRGNRSQAWASTKENMVARMNGGPTLLSCRLCSVMLQCGMTGRQSRWRQRKTVHRTWPPVVCSLAELLSSEMKLSREVCVINDIEYIPATKATETGILNI